MNTRLALGIGAAVLVGISIPIVVESVEDDSPHQAYTNLPVSAATPSPSDEQATSHDLMTDVVTDRTGPEETAQAFTSAMTTFDATVDHSEHDAVTRASGYTTVDLYSSLMETLATKDAPRMWRQLTADRARGSGEIRALSVTGSGDERRVAATVRQRVESRNASETHEFDFQLTLLKKRDSWVVSEATW